ncbi:HD-GYP domain-containing protein [Inediibacterium massiliense]|uniref:HD-GYP domain-containing protein n=1 Tax=Inediibacterium massiliense TaxID=1658111 RepID=UPI0006B4EC65|nr:HD-GYP domain-containing protein [Inediibacterium massiliense]
MFKVNIEYIKPGMILAKTLQNIDGQILLSAGVKLKENYIQKLREIGINQVYIETEETSDIVIEDVICEQNRFEAKKVIRETMNDLYMGRHAQMEGVFHTISNLLDDLLGNRDILLNLSDIKTADEYTFAHSVNVCVLSLITGIAMGYNRERLEKLGVGAILHDIGKVWIPKEILNKPAKLTEEEYKRIKTHSKLGYDMIKRYDYISSLSAIVVLTHHERYDGKGYPLGKKGEEIHEFARIVSIADVYDALTSDRVYKKKMFPHEAVEYLVSMGGHQFDYEIVKKFIAHVAVYPLGTMVVLSTGEKGIVIKVDHTYPNRPTIRCMYGVDGEKYDIFKELNLIDYPSIMIIEVLEKLE